MNIFYLHSDPVIAAQAMTNKHVVKMIIESAQLLSAAHHILDGDKASEDLYKVTHKNHPSGIWTRESIENYNWLYRHFIALCHEYTKRYGRIHMTQTKLESLLSHPPMQIPKTIATPIKVAISDTKWHVKHNPIQSYRNYYVGEKLKLDVDIIRYNKIIGEII
jgi:hypothetical protein